MIAKMTQEYNDFNRYSNVGAVLICSHNKECIKRIERNCNQIETYLTAPKIDKIKANDIVLIYGGTAVNPGYRIGIYRGLCLVHTFLPAYLA